MAPLRRIRNNLPRNRRRRKAKPAPIPATGHWTLSRANRRPSHANAVHPNRRQSPRPNPSQSPRPNPKTIENAPGDRTYRTYRTYRAHDEPYRSYKSYSRGFSARASVGAFFYRAMSVEPCRYVGRRRQFAAQQREEKVLTQDGVERRLINYARSLFFQL